MVALDRLAGLGSAFDDVRVNGTLPKKFDAGLFAGLLFKNTDKLAADNLAFLFGIRNAGQPIQKTVGGIDIDQVDFQLFLKYIHHLFRLPLAHQAVIDVHAG